MSFDDFVWRQCEEALDEAAADVEAEGRERNLGDWTMLALRASGSGEVDIGLEL